MNKLKAMAIVTVVALSAGACGTNQPDRSIGGAGILGASGAAIGAISGPWGALIGFLVGAATGAGVGALTKPSDIDLGPPIWK